MDVSFPTWLSPGFRALLLTLCDSDYSKRPSADDAWRRLAFMACGGASLASPGGDVPTVSQCERWLNELRLECAVTENRVRGACH